MSQRFSLDLSEVRLEEGRDSSTQSARAEDDLETGSDGEFSARLVSSGPPKVSLHLTASEPAGENEVSTRADGEFSEVRDEPATSGSETTDLNQKNDNPELTRYDGSSNEDASAEKNKEGERHEVFPQDSPPINTNNAMSEPTQSETESNPQSLASNEASDGLAESSSAGSSSGAPAFGSAVQLTFSLQIASLQLTPAFGVGCLRLKPVSKTVSMCLEPSQNPQSSMNLQIDFEVADIQLADGFIRAIRLHPAAQKPTNAPEASSAASTLEFLAIAGDSPGELIPSRQSEASVRLRTQFKIAAIEFSPLFQVAAIVLNSTSQSVSLQLPGADARSTENAPVFEMENVRLSGGKELELIEVAPARA
ncbi:MAG: hypothetical protein ABI540_03510 [Spartobacteria bacterium]